MPDLPTGTLTFLFTDVEGSTRLWEQQPEAMRQALGRHDAIIEEETARQDGVVVRPRGEGDSRFAVFARATDAVAAAVAIQQALHAEAWAMPTPLRVRMALHTGEADLRDGDYYGSAVNRCARLRAVAHGGQMLVSQATRDLVLDCLGPDLRLSDLGAQRLEGLQRSEGIFQLLAPGLATEFPPLRSLDPLPNDLPLQMTSFVAREQELEEVKRLLGQARLVTLTGPGGSGKTRLALAAAAAVAGRYGDGALFVDLSAIRDPALVASAVARALGIGDAGDRPLLEMLRRSLAERRLLLLLDNFEQVLPAAPLLADWLAGSPGLTLLVTSRQLLRLRGEQVWPVPPLALPALGARSTVAAAADAPAVALFVQRARAVRPEFALTERNAPAIVALCARLDGLPLAIELAASQVRLFAPDAILARLEQRLPMPGAGATDAPERQRTLPAALAWSNDLLTPEAQRIFRRLAVFAGGFSLDAARNIAGDGATTRLGGDSEAALEALAALVDRHLVVAETSDGEPRFRLLETVRDFGLGELTTRGELAAVRERHARYFLALAEDARPKLESTGVDVWLGRLDAEHDNFRAALQWALERGEGATPALRLGVALWPFWYVRGYLGEGRRWLEQALVAGSGGPASPQAAPIRVQALVGAGMLAHYQADPGRTAILCGEALALARKQGDQGGVAAALNGLALAARAGGDCRTARTMYEEALSILRPLGDGPSLFYTLHYLGIVCWMQGDLERAQTVLEEALARARARDSRRDIAIAQEALGFVRHDRGDAASARTLFSDALPEFRALGDQRGIAKGLWGLGKVAAVQGRDAEAATLFAEAATIFARVGDRWYAAVCLYGLAGTALARGRGGQAARLLGAAATIFESIGVPPPPTVAPAPERTLAAARAQLGHGAFTAAFAAGQALSLEAAIAEHEQGSDELRAGAPGAPAGGAPSPSPLTAREREVAALIARGLTNRQIATTLVIAEGTADRHVANILEKLDFTSRAQVAAWVARR